MTDTSPSFNNPHDLRHLTGQAAHLMWLERQLEVQRRNEKSLRLVLMLSAVFDIIAITALLTVLRETLPLADAVLLLIIGFLLAELALLLYLLARVSKRRKALQDEIDLITRGYIRP